MTTLVTRDQMRPGQTVQRVTTQTYRVLPTTWTEDSKLAGLHKLQRMPPDLHEWQLVRGRWRVRWRPPFSFLGTHIDGFWIAEEQDRKNAGGDHEWRTFGTWAEAIAYADRMARQA